LKNEDIDEYHLQAIFMITLADALSKEMKLTRNPINNIQMIDMTDVLQRRMSFSHQWKEYGYNIHDLATEGFFALNEPYTVQCFSCGIVWTRFPKDVPSHTLHRITSPYCRKVIGNEIIERKEDTRLLKVEYTNWKSGDIPLNSVIARKSSFPLMDWLQIDSTIEEIAKAGFYCNQEKPSGLLKCYACQGMYADWEKDDDPWKIHARLFPFCPHLVTRKGADFIQEIQKETTHEPMETLLSEELKKQVRTRKIEEILKQHEFTLSKHNTLTMLTTTKQFLKTFNFVMQYYSRSKIDKVDYINSGMQQARTLSLERDLNCITYCENPRNVVFMPCLHIVICVACSGPQFVRCPICRRDIEKTLQVYHVQSTSFYVSEEIVNRKYKCNLTN